MLPLESHRQGLQTSEGAESEQEPQAVLNTIGSLFKCQDSDCISPRSPQSSLVRVPLMETFPGWTRVQLRCAAEKKARYFAQSASATKRDIAPGLDPVERAIVDKNLATSLHRK
jgi:hypothetical protein